VFSCESGFAAMLGSFDGRDRRTLITYAVERRPEQLLVSMHEQLHEELHWSTAWGVVAAMGGLLARSGTRGEVLGPVAVLMNSACREVHERFATTISSGAIGVPAARGLLAGNARYLGYLEEGLELGGPADVWPWQFRESAIQMLLRTLMQPAELADVAERGFARLRRQDVALEAIHPDVRLAAVSESAARWWEETFADVMAAHPERGGDTGGMWMRELPEDAEAMDRLKAWEETVLIPALGDTARRNLAAAGMATLAQDEYLDVVEALRTSFLELAPSDWQVDVLVERRRMQEEMLGAEREALMIAGASAQVALCDAEELPARATDFLLQGPDGPHALAVLLDRTVLRRQFAGLDDIPVDGPPLLAIAGSPVVADSRRQVPMALMRPDVPPAALVGMFTSLPVITLSSLRTSLDPSAREALLDLDEAYLLVDLPLRTQIAAWIAQTGRVRLRVTDVEGPRPMNLVVLQPDELPSLWMLSFRSDGGIGELAQLLDRHPGQLTADLDIPASVVHRIGMIVAWIHAAWYALEEIPP
jgi:hypothetical protein